MAEAPLGVILAGGRSRRFGRRKALADVGGRPMIERVRNALAAVVDNVVLIANEPEPYEPFGLATRPDTVAGAGPLAGIEAALAWAEERGRHGALVVACDMPLVTPALLHALLDEARATGAPAVVPESDGPRGFEPLCAYYGVGVLGMLRARLAARRYGTADAACALGARRLPAVEVQKYGGAAALFLNVNDPADRDRAEVLWNELAIRRKQN